MCMRKWEWTWEERERERKSAFQKWTKSAFSLVGGWERFFPLSFLFSHFFSQNFSLSLFFFFYRSHFRSLFSVSFFLLFFFFFFFHPLFHILVTILHSKTPEFEFVILSSRLFHWSFRERRKEEETFWNVVVLNSTLDVAAGCKKRHWKTRPSRRTHPQTVKKKKKE